MKRLTVKSTKEMLEVLEETRETLLKDHKTDPPTANGNKNVHK